MLGKGSSPEGVQALEEVPEGSVQGTCCVPTVPSLPSRGMLTSNS